MKAVKDGRYSSEKERKSERLVELLDSVDENFVDETYSIDSAEKLRERMRAEAPERRAKMLRSPYLRRCLIAAACFVLVFGVLLGGVELLENLIDPTKGPTITDNRYPPVSLPSLEDMGKDAITSLDMLNYYSAMKALGEGTASSKATVGRTLLSAGGESENSDDTLGGVVPLPEVKDEADESQVYYYELDENEVFTVTKAIYFQIKLTDENGFLAQKIGTGTVDVVITENSLEPMITFRNGERYYSCLLNAIENPEEEITNYVFTTHKYIEGFCIVKNLEQENYGFKISFDELGQAMSFACNSFKNGTMPDGAIEILTQTLSRELNIEFTIEQLERYFGLGDFSEIVDEILIPSEGLQFELSNDGQSYELAGIGECTDPLVIIPSEYEGLPVTSIKANAFENCNTITSITVPGSIKTIGDRAFKNCAALAAVVLLDGVEVIEEAAFYNCTSLTNVVFRNGFKRIEDMAFENCLALRELILPDCVTTIGSYAFSGCQELEKVILSKSLTTMGDYAFRNCKSLLSIDVPDGISAIGKYTFSGCESLENVQFGPALKGIGAYSFENCVSLKDIVIPNMVIQIGECAFLGCTSVESVSTPFIGCKPENDYTLSRPNVSYRKFASIFGVYNGELPASLTSVVLTGGKLIDNDAFAGCKYIENITLSDETLIIGNYAFSACESLETITIPDNVTSIGNNAFYNCFALESVTLSSQISEIQMSLFEGCNSLRSVTLGDKIAFIDYNVFLHCEYLDSIYFKGSAKKWNNIGKHRYWDQGLHQYTVYCDDENIVVNKPTSEFNITFSAALSKIKVGMKKDEVFAIVPEEHLTARYPWDRYEYRSSNGLIVRIIFDVKTVSEIIINGIDASTFASEATAKSITVGMNFEEVKGLMGTTMLGKTEDGLLTRCMWVTTNEYKEFYVWFDQNGKVVKMEFKDIL